MTKKINLGIVFGGKSPEHEVSIVSAESICRAADINKYQIHPFAISKEGDWLLGDQPFTRLKQGNIGEGSPLPPAKILEMDVIFPVLHGPYGEDGTIQGMMEMLNLPYVGCSVISSAVTMDKEASKRLLKQSGLPIVPYLSLDVDSWKANQDKICGQIKKLFPFPCFIKPANMGSSVGISKVEKFDQLETAIQTAFKFDQKIVVEKGVEAREIEVAVLGNQELLVSPPGEIIVKDGFYDFHNKYVNDSSQTIIPAQNLSSRKTDEIKDLAIKAFKALYGQGFARVDFLLDKKSGRVFINELNTIPGFTQISMYPKLMAQAGVPYPQLIDRLIQLAFQKTANKQECYTSFDSKSDWYKKK